MAKVTNAERHLSEEEILKRMKRTVGFWRVQKWLAILRRPRRKENTSGYLIIRNKQIFLVELSGTAHLYLIYPNVSKLVQSEWFLSLNLRKRGSG
ncbi:MAG: hypothetical protein ACP5VS_06630 [Desulfomonilaceae bacterium]